MRIVIVEDEVRIREGMRKLLSKADKTLHIVGEAENGREGVELIVKLQPDLVLADIRMPELDGLEMLQTLHEQNIKPAAIFLSAYSDFHYAQQAMKLGVSEYLVKPIVVSELIGAVKRVQEMLNQQRVTQSGLRSLNDTLGDALFAPDSLTRESLCYAEQHFQTNEQTQFALLLFHCARETDRVTQRLKWDCEALRLGKVEVFSLSIPDNHLVAWYQFGSKEHLAFELEKSMIASWCKEDEPTPVAILGFCEGLFELNGLLQTLYSHLDYGLLAWKTSLLRYPEVRTWEMKLFSYPIETENAARLALCKHNDSAVRARLSDFGRLFECGISYAPRDIKEAHVRMAWALLSTARDLGIAAAEQLSRQDLLDKIMSAVQLEALAHLRQELWETLCSPAPIHPRKTSLLVRRAETMMKDYYTQGITLDEMAQRLSVTPEYLGTQIHHELGCTFGTLMKRLRVERAKELLLSTDHKLYEIAQTVGYLDAKHFSKVFRDLIGMLPAEFRRMRK